VSSFVIEQGVKMGRPSEIRLEVTRRAGEVVAVTISGQVVPVMEGELVLD
jgi:trans-2,3-dihydro-3-hydroxyanthranilate isomerase